jgi:hypothetical protein
VLSDILAPVDGNKNFAEQKKHIPAADILQAINSPAPEQLIRCHLPKP